MTTDQYGNGSSSRDYTFDLRYDARSVVKSELWPQTALLMDFIQIIKSLVGKKNKINILLEKHSSVLPTSANISMTDHPGRYKLMILLEKHVRVDTIR
ncbi:hypothetical protein PF003_g1793 [Phytophthora fragariae]|nr:hypothetical protein PF003_g1793 [Phytophthora fragariae]